MDAVSTASLRFMLVERDARLNAAVIRQQAPRVFQLQEDHAIRVDAPNTFGCLEIAGRLASSGSASPSTVAAAHS